MKCNYDYIYGIDPDVYRSGVAKLDISTKEVKVFSFELHELFEYLNQEVEYATSNQRKYLIIVESFTNEYNSHMKNNGYYSKAKAASFGFDLGRNQQVGISIIEFCKYIGIDAKAQLPFKKCWSGPDRKITHAEISEITKWGYKRSNQEVRDATLIAWLGAELPITISLKITKPTK